MHWKPIYDQFWKLHSAYFAKENVPPIETSFKKLLLLRCQTLQHVGDVKVTEYISKLVFSASNYYRYFGKKHIRRAFVLAKEKILQHATFKAFLHGGGASGKTCLGMRISQNTFNFE